MTEGNLSKLLGMYYRISQILGMSLPNYQTFYHHVESRSPILSEVIEEFDSFPRLLGELQHKAAMVWGLSDDSFAILTPKSMVLTVSLNRDKVELIGFSALLERMLNNPEILNICLAQFIISANNAAVGRTAYPQIAIMSPVTTAKVSDVALCTAWIGHLWEQMSFGWWNANSFLGAKQRAKDTILHSCDEMVILQSLLKEENPEPRLGSAFEQLGWITADQEFNMYQRAKVLGLTGKKLTFGQS